MADAPPRITASMWWLATEMLSGRYELWVTHVNRYARLVPTEERSTRRVQTVHWNIIRAVNRAGYLEKVRDAVPGTGTRTAWVYKLSEAGMAAVAAEAERRREERGRIFQEEV